MMARPPFALFARLILLSASSYFFPFRPPLVYGGYVLFVATTCSFGPLVARFAPRCFPDTAALPPFSSSFPFLSFCSPFSGLWFNGFFFAYRDRPSGLRVSGPLRS